MNLVILTGNSFRHKYFANTIGKKFPAVAVFSEIKVFDPANQKAGASNLKDQQRKLWQWHFGLAQKEEGIFFGEHKEFNNCGKVEQVPKGEINEKNWVKKISAYKPDIVAVYGTSLLREEVIDICPKTTVNMHLGLSPYYRGSGTNFWPLYDGHPEYVGVTIHRIDPGIDTGPIFHQGRPNVEVSDNQHSIGNKAIIVGTNLMIKTIEEIQSGQSIAYEQKEKGKLYTRKDFSPDSIARLKTNMDSGLIRDYAGRQEVLRERVKIVE